MAILSRVSQRALWLRRISSMPVSTSVGARGAADRSPLSVTRSKRIILFLTRHSALMKVHILGRHGKTKVETTSGSASSKDTVFVRTLMRASFRVHVRLADYAPSGEVLGHRGNVAKLNRTLSFYSSTEQVLDRSSRWSLGENQRSLHDLGGW